MTMADVVAPFIAAALAGTLALLVLRNRSRHSLPLPPGPRPLPLIGNLLDVPKEKDWLTYRAWNDQYGDIVYINALGQKVVVLGSAQAVNDLLEQRGSIYSDRPTTPMGDLMKFEWSFVVLPYGDMWRRKRKLMTAHLHAGVAERYHPVQLASARRFARDILATGKSIKSLRPAVSLFVGQLIMKAVYGIDVEHAESEYITYPEKLIEDFSIACTPGRFMVDFLPFLKYVPAWFPGASFQRFAQQNHITQREALDRPIAVVKSGMADGTAPPSLARTLLEDDTTHPSAQSQLDLIKDVAGLIYIAGADTTGSALLSFFLAMLVYPEVQAKAQAEVDHVVGPGRLPDINDKKDMSYVQALVNECLRWMPVAPTAVPHRVTQDDEYKGYLIPKGTIVLGSVWSILHNAEDYPEPERFMPERFLTPEGALDPSVRDPRTACFGFGRRVCPGRFIADATLFIAVATLLATVNIVRAKDTDGVDIVPEVESTSGIVCHAKPFPWSARPRSQEAEALLAAAQ